uniref:Uncharacterized protein LOC100175133 n=1 Tax=Phallusia mammillata TaxID=59560 RepID=A0A6F9DFI3_9ASCI|nr:uncharacterized protein LOC100175133 [Phallusia mammillata]
MDYDGSITPPLSDDEDCSEKLESSPVLRKKPRHDVKALSPKTLLNTSCGNIEVNNYKNENAEEHFYHENITIVDRKSLFRNERDITRSFYKGMMNLRDLRDSESKQKCDEVDYLVSLLTDINEYVLSDINQDDVTCILRMLCMLCNESSSIMNCTNIPAYRNAVKKFVQSNKPTFLHMCDSQKFISFFHMYTKIHTCLMEVISVILDKFSMLSLEVLHFNGHSLNEFVGIKQQICNKVVLDLLSASENLFNQLVGKENNTHSAWRLLYSKCPFPCECFQDFFKNKVAKLLEEQQFWIILNTHLTNIIQNSQASTNEAIGLTSGIKCNNISTSLSFVWWWMGEMPYTSNVTSSHSLIIRLVRLSLRNCESEDETLMFHLLCYRDIIKSVRKAASMSTWSTTELAPFYLLWHHYSQKFLLPKPKSSGTSSTNINHYLTRNISLDRWLSDCQNLINFHSSNTSECEVDSFSVFLSIVATIAGENNGEVWGQIRSRLLSRIPVSAVKHANEQGLQRLFSLLLVLLLTLPKEDAADALTEWFELSENCLLACGKSSFFTQKLLITGFYAVIYFCNEKEISFLMVAKKVAKNFSQICRLLISDVKASQHQEIWKLFTSYVECLVTIMQCSSSYSLGQIEFVPPNSISCVTEKCRPHEAIFIATSASEILLSIRQQVERNKVCTNTKALFILIGTEILPWCRRVSGTHDEQTNSCVLEIIYNMTKISQQLCDKDDVSPVSFSNLWKFFASEGKVDATLRCQYMCKILTDRSLGGSLFSEAVEEWTIQGWIKSCYILPDEKLTKLNREVGKLQMIQKICPSSDVSFHLKILTASLSDKFQKSSKFLERVTWSGMASKFFMPTVDTAVRVLKTPAIDATTVMCTYCAVGRIMQDCTHMLFSNGKPSYVSKIVESFVLSSKCTPYMNTSLLHTLHKFVIGLLKLGNKSLYLQKTVRDIFKLHLTRWPCFTSVGKTGLKHPSPFLKVILHMSVTSDDQDWFIKQLHMYSTNDSSAEKLTVIVEILHYWLVVHLKGELETSKIDSVECFIPLLQQARIQLRTNQASVDKTNTLLNLIRNNS